MVNVLGVEGGGLVKSFWSNSSSVITSDLNSLCSFNWIRYFLLLIQNSDIAFLCPAKQLLHFPPQWYLELNSGGFSINSGNIHLCFPSLIRDLFEYWLVFMLLKVSLNWDIQLIQNFRMASYLRDHLVLYPSWRPSVFMEKH